MHLTICVEMLVFMLTLATHASRGLVHGASLSFLDQCFLLVINGVSFACAKGHGTAGH